MSLGKKWPLLGQIKDWLGGEIPLAELGTDERARATGAGRPVARVQGADCFASICPYCAVGCSTHVYVKGGQIVNVEGNPHSPINEGTLCPKGSSIYELTVNPHRLTGVLYRRPGGTEWEQVSLAWAMERIAQRVKETRDATMRLWDDPEGQAPTLIRQCGGIASLGGACLDNEENYLIKKLFTAGLGAVWIENQARV